MTEASPVPTLERIPRKPWPIQVADGGSAPPEITFYYDPGEGDDVEDSSCQIRLIGDANEVAADLEAAAKWLRSFPLITEETDCGAYITVED